MVNKVDSVLLDMYRFIKSSEDDGDILCLSTMFLGGLFLAYSCNLVGRSTYDLYLEFISDECKRLKCSGASCPRPH